MQSHIRKVYACLAVTCHLHFWQNDRDLLRATVVTRGWNGYRNKSQHLVSCNDLFSLRSWCRKLHIWSPNYTSTLALHELHRWLHFGYAIPTSVIRSYFLMRSYFLTQPPCSKGMWARLWYARIKSCNSDAGFGANIGSERSRNSLQLGDNVRVEEVSVWNFFRGN